MDVTVADDAAKLRHEEAQLSIRGPHRDTFELGLLKRRRPNGVAREFTLSAKCREVLSIEVKAMRCVSLLRRDAQSVGHPAVENGMSHYALQVEEPYLGNVAVVRQLAYAIVASSAQAPTADVASPSGTRHSRWPERWHISMPSPSPYFRAACDSAAA